MLAGKWQGFTTMSPSRLIVMVALSLVLFYNGALWHALNNHVPFDSVKSAIFYASFAGFLTAFIALLLTPVSFKYLLKPALILLLLCSASAAYFMNSYGVAIDSVMVQNVFETNVGEVSALISLRLLAYLFLLGILPAVLVWRIPVTYPLFARGLLNKLLALVLSLLAVVVTVAPFYSTYAPLFRKSSTLTHFINPTNYIYAVSKYVQQRLVI
ncbi:MAG TPA: DUF1705 domain-containing protein, partial [Pseudomonadales bacterium]|nr:DUF1705 domain-containing protein [Pseudomonadales bacterium]